MAATLLETLRQQGPQQLRPQPQLQDVTQQAQELLRARTGKAVDPGMRGPGISAIGERLAAQEEAAQAQQLRQQEQIQQQVVEQQKDAFQQESRLRRQQVEEEAVGMEDSFVRQSEQILNNLSRQTRELDFRRDASKLEQLGVSMRLSNEKYVFNLQQEGKRARLDNDIRFREEMTRTVFEEDMHMFQENLNFRRLVASDEREFQRQVARFSLDEALQLSRMESAAASQRMMWGAGAQILTGGIMAYSKFGGEQQAGDDTGAGGME